jgi:hypothetical protein
MAFNAVNQPEKALPLAKTDITAPLGRVGARHSQAEISQGLRHRHHARTTRGPGLIFR